MAGARFHVENVGYSDHVSANGRVRCVDLIFPVMTLDWTDHVGLFALDRFHRPLPICRTSRRARDLVRLVSHPSLHLLNPAKNKRMRLTGQDFGERGSESSVDTLHVKGPGSL